MSYTTRQLAALSEASSDRLAFAGKCVRSLVIGGKDYTRYIESCTYRGEDGIAWILDAILTLPLGSEIENAECRLDWHVEGESYPGFVGKVVIRKTDGIFTAVKAATEGYEVERTPLGASSLDDREFAGVAPSTALADGLAPLAYRGYDIPYVAAPPINRRGTEALRWTASVKDVCNVVEEEAALLARDTSANVAAAYLDGPLAGEPGWTFEEGKDTDFGGVQEETAEDERVYAVQMYRVAADGTHTAATTPVVVDNHGRFVPPASVLLIAYSDTDAAPPSGGLTAYQTAIQEAARRGKSDSKLTLECVYPPFFLQRGQMFYALSRELLPDTETARRYLARVETITVDTDALSGTLTGEAELVSTEVLKRETARFAAAPGFEALPWGFDTDIVPYFDTSLPWVFDVGSALELDIEIAAGYGVAITQEPSVIQISNEPA